MKLTLTTWERVMLTVVLGGLSGINLATLRKANKAMDKVEFSPEEKKEIGLVELPAGGGVTWAENKEYNVEIGDPEAANVLKMAFNQFSGWKVENSDQIEALAAKLEPKE